MISGAFGVRRVQHNRPGCEVSAIWFGASKPVAGRRDLQAGGPLAVSLRALVIADAVHFALHQRCVNHTSGKATSVQ